MAQKYRVTASSKVFRVEPGDTFERDLDPVTEARLIDSGAIEKVSNRRPSYRPPSPAISSFSATTEQVEPASGDEDKE